MTGFSYEPTEILLGILSVSELWRQTPTQNTGNATAPPDYSDAQGWS